MTFRTLTTDRGREAESAVALLTWGDDRFNAEVTPETLADLHVLLGRVETSIWSQAQVLRHRGVSWQVIGDALGISRQAAQQRYGR